tara:strand:+ start:1481 stop:2134 length:654 start_codon:yes stop_codon:yes gene_type:complete
MELTTQQIQKIEHYLTKNRVDFVDIRLEVLDHIVSDIEVLIKKENIEFDTAFYKVTDKWNLQLKQTSSFYFGIMYSESKIVVKKAVEVFKPYFLLYFSAYFLPFILLELFPVQLSSSLASFTNGFLFITLSLAIIYMLFIIEKTSQSKINTTYRFILKTQFLGIILLVLGLLTEIYKTSTEMNPVYTGFMCAGFSVVFICNQFYKKHKEAIKKYKIS